MGTTTGGILDFNLDSRLVGRNWVAHNKQVTCMKLLEDGSLVSGSQDQKLYVWNINVSPPSKISSFSSHTDDVSCVDQLSKSVIVSADIDGGLFVWNPTSGATLTSKLVAHPSSILALRALSNTSFACGDANGNVYLWSYVSAPASLTQRKSLIGHTSKVLAIESLLNGNLASVSFDGYANVWELTNATLLNRFSPLLTTTAYPSCLKQLPDGSVAYAGNDVNLFAWNIDTQANSQTMMSSVNAFNSTSKFPCVGSLLFNYTILALVTTSGGIMTMKVNQSSHMVANTLYYNAVYLASCIENLST